jgi:hypothetical protein
MSQTRNDLFEASLSELLKEAERAAQAPAPCEPKAVQGGSSVATEQTSLPPADPGLAPEGRHRS